MCYLFTRTLIATLALVWFLFTYTPQVAHAQNSTEQPLSQILETVPSWVSPPLQMPRSLAWGDVDNDGDLDLAVGTESGSQNMLFKNEGGRLSQTPLALTEAISRTMSIAWGDMDRDGDLDLAVGNFCQPNEVYENIGGAFSKKWSDERADPTAVVRWGDMDGDGYLELAVGNGGIQKQKSPCPSSGVEQTLPNRIYKNDGGQLMKTAIWTDGVQVSTSALAWGDIDNDGDLDLAVGHYYGDDCGHSCGVQIYINEQGLLQDHPNQTIAFPGAFSDIAWGDVQRDGFPELAVVDHWLWSRARFYSNTEGILTETDQSFGRGTLGWTVDWVDVNRDGMLEIFEGTSGDAVSNIYQIEGATLTANAIWSSQDTIRIFDSAWGDVDNDGDLDLAVVTLGNFVSLYKNDLLPAIEFDSTQEPCKNCNSRTVAWGDMDNDGDLDLAIANYRQPNQIYRNENGELTSTAWTDNVNEDSYALAWGDVDDDGDLDLAIGNGGQPNKVYLNDQDVLTNRLAWTDDMTDVTMAMAWGDIDNDGDLDLAVGNWGQSNKVYLNEAGELTKKLAWSDELQEDTFAVAWGDIDNDGDLDLAIGNNHQRDKVYLNKGGTLTEVVWSDNFPNGATRSMAWGDVDGDGDLDLAVGYWGQPNRLYLNVQGRLQTQSAWGTQASEGTEHLAWGDVDGDGDLDLVVANAGGGNGAVSDPDKIYLNHNGILQTDGELIWSPANNSQSFGAAWGDVDGDGDLDLVVARGDQSSVITEGTKIYRNQQTELRQTASVAIDLNNRSGLVTVADYYASSVIWRGPLIPVHYTVYTTDKPITHLRAFYSTNGGGSWLPAIHAKHEFAIDNTLHISPTITSSDSSTSGIYHWDVTSSDFFGQSDNVIFRLEAYPSLTHPNGVAHSYQQSYVSTQSYPFRVRGTQIRVMTQGQASDTSNNGTQKDATPNIARDAIVYRATADGDGIARMLADSRGTAYRSDHRGYLQGRGQIGQFDKLVALVPVEPKFNFVAPPGAFAFYHTSASSSSSGVRWKSFRSSELAKSSVQTLTVSADNPLLLFNPIISVEWDARNDGAFQADLQTAIERASAVLYDVTNGQMALGTVRVYQNKEQWYRADVQIHASNSLRPRATMGGVVDQRVDDPSGVTAYQTGIIRMGANWDPFGQSLTELTENWWRAFAHELSHYLLFLPDNYQGVNEDGIVVATDCLGSFMTNVYDEERYGEFLTKAQWESEQYRGCLQTVAAKTTQRSDWETITHFYPMFKAPTRDFPGPSRLTLDVTHVQWVEPSPSTGDLAPQPLPLPSRIFDLRDAEERLLTVRQAQAYLIKTQNSVDVEDDYVIALGSTGASSDRIKVRGAERNDRICVVEPHSTQTRYGCQTLSARSASVQLDSIIGWNPDVDVRSILSNTIAITVTGQFTTENVRVQFLPSYVVTGTMDGVHSPDGELVCDDSARAVVCTQVLTLTDPVAEGFIRVWIPDKNPNRSDPNKPLIESFSQFFLSDGWGPSNPGYGCGADRRAQYANQLSLSAPVASGDGRVTIHNAASILDDAGTAALQSLADLPSLPQWATQVGPGYRFRATQPTMRSIAFEYLQRDVPRGYEHTLQIYYQPDGASHWQPLPTGVDIEHNLATTRMPDETGGEGIYVLIAVIELPPLGPGWNLFAYPVHEERLASEALVSIAPYYTALYALNPFTANVDGGAISTLPFNAEATSDWQLYERHNLDSLQLSFGHSYWIYIDPKQLRAADLTQVTPYLRVPTQN